VDSCANSNLNIEIDRSKIQKPKKRLANTDHTSKRNIELMIVDIDEQLNQLPQVSVKTLKRGVAKIREAFFKLFNQINGIDDISEFCSNGEGGHS
jgi:hypothetical protein